MKQGRRVNSEKLARFGFSAKEIEAAENMEKAGLFEMEPSPDLVDRTVERCAAVLNHNEVVTDDVPVLSAPLRLAEGYFAALKELSPALLKSGEWETISRLQELQQACLATAHFAHSRRVRPFVMLDNHNLVEPSWWSCDTGFRAFRNACQIANKVAVESGVPPAACVVVLRPRIDDYSSFDLEAIEELLRTGTGDVWWIPYQQAGRYQTLDLIVLGEERTWELTEKAKSPVEALDAFRELINQSEANRLRNQLNDIARIGTPILVAGHLTKSAASQLQKSDGIRKLMDNVIGEELVEISC
jgi:hypothetical protein